MAKAKKTASKKSPASSKRVQSASLPSKQELELMIAEAAYYKAEQRNFIPGFEHQDWFEAESEINSSLQIS